MIRIRISDPRSEITQIVVDQMNRWIHSGQGFVGSSDLPWSKWSRDRWSWSGSSQRNAPMESSISSLQWSRRSTLGSICRYMWCQLQIFTRNMKLVSTNDNQKVTRDKLLFITNSIPWTKQKPRKVLRKMNAVWGFQTSLKHDAIETLRTLNDWISSAHGEVSWQRVIKSVSMLSCITSEKTTHFSQKNPKKFDLI